MKRLNLQRQKVLVSVRKDTLRLKTHLSIKHKKLLIKRNQVYCFCIGFIVIQEEKQKRLRKKKRRQERLSNDKKITQKKMKTNKRKIGLTKKQQKKNRTHKRHTKENNDSIKTNK